jgi:hypothetical protein
VAHVVVHNAFDENLTAFIVEVIEMLFENDKKWIPFAHRVGRYLLALFSASDHKYNTYRCCKPLLEGVCVVNYPAFPTFTPRFIPP